MNQSSARVLRYLTGNEDIEDVPADELQRLLDESPYFAVTQFLLAKKLKAANSSTYLRQVQKTALYFSNPFWLHYQLNEHLQEIPENEKHLFDNKTENPNKAFKKQSEVDEAADNSSAFSQPGKPRKSVIVDTTRQVPGDSSPVPAGESELAEARQQSAEDLLNSEVNTKPNTNQPDEEMAAIARIPDEQTERFLLETTTLQQVDIPDRSDPVMQETINAAPETIEVLEEMAGVARETDEATEVFLGESQASEVVNVQPPIPVTEDASPASNSSENEDEEITQEDEHDKMFQNIKAMLDATSEEADADVDTAVIPLDPYYTIDYFASQGIKLELDQNPKDELGQHLKKFTQWLKHMKKLGPEDATEVIARTETDADIQKIADSSNTVRDVVTEAMASVLEKQGKKDKAIQLYNKLSFLNPHKSAYFAAKIKILKGI